MTLADLDNTVSHAGNGVTVAFPIPFPFLVNTHIKVYSVVDATGVETLETLYSLSGTGGLTGTCTMNTAPPTGTTLFIRRVLPLTQETDYVDNDAFGAATSEATADRAIMIAQQVATDVARALKKKGQTGLNYDAGSVKITAMADGVATTDAATVGQISTLVNAAVALVQSYPALSVVTAFALTLLDDANAAAMRTTLGLGPLATSAAAGTTGEVIRGDGTNATFVTDGFSVQKTGNSPSSIIGSLSATTNNSGAGPSISNLTATDTKSGRSINIGVASTTGIDINATEAFVVSVDNGVTENYNFYAGGMKANARELGYREIAWTVHNASRTLSLASDLTTIPNKGIQKTDAAAYSYTIPLNATDAFPIGYVLPIANMGTAGAISIVPTGGVTLRLGGSTSASATRTFAAGAFGGICKNGTDDWTAYGSGVS